MRDSDGDSACICLRGLSETPLDKKVRNAKKKLRQVEEKTGKMPSGELTAEQARGALTSPHHLLRNAPCPSMTRRDRV